MEDYKKYIGAHPEICHGQPCFKINGKLSRIMVYLVLEFLEGGESFDDILKGYPNLTKKHLQAALHFAAQIIKSEEYTAFAEST